MKIRTSGVVWMETPIYSFSMILRHIYSWTASLFFATFEFTRTRSFLLNSRSSPEVADGPEPFLFPC